MDETALLALLYGTVDRVVLAALAYTCEAESLAVTVGMPVSYASRLPDSAKTSRLWMEMTPPVLLRVWSVMYC